MGNIPSSWSASVSYRSTLLHHLKVLCLLAVMDNYKNVPQFLYGLRPAQMEMFMNDDNPYNRQSQKVTEVSDVI